MFSTVLFYLQNDFVVGAIALVLGVLFSQKIKDWIAGVPSELRTALFGVEQKAKMDISAATADILAKLPAPVSAKLADFTPAQNYESQPPAPAVPLNLPAEGHPTPQAV